MRIPQILGLLLGPLLGSLLLSIPVGAQCGQGLKQLKNDALPAALGTLTKVAVVPGLCVNEAAMSVFNAGGPVDVHEVGIVFAHQTATNGIKALVDVEIYDGATVDAAGKYKLGPLLFKLSKTTSQNLQIQSTGYNTYKLKTPVTVPTGQPVIGFRMLMNLASGSCATGYQANFATDNQFTCTPGINILDALKHGPVDPCTYKGFGVPLYPLYFRGSWIIRACVKPKVSTVWTGNATPGGFVSFKFLAPGQAGDQYFAMMSGGIKTGLTTPWGKLPLDADPIFLCFLSDCRSALLGNSGTFNSKGEAFGALSIPNLSSLKGLDLYAGFFTYKAPNFFAWKSISTASSLIPIR